MGGTYLRDIHALMMGDLRLWPVAAGSAGGRGHKRRKATSAEAYDAGWLASQDMGTRDTARACVEGTKTPQIRA